MALIYNPSKSVEEPPLSVLPLSCAFLLLLATAGPTGQRHEAKTSNPSAQPTSKLGLDLQGTPIAQLTRPDTRIVVLFFAASDCPVSSRYVPEINALRHRFEAQNVAFWWVFPNPADTSVVVREHQRKFAIEGNTILDTDQTLVRLAHADVTPEATVFHVTTGGLQELYRGRVDDRYSALGTERPKATEHFLENAIVSALVGKTIAPAVTKPVGCSIVPLAAK